MPRISTYFLKRNPGLYHKSDNCYIQRVNLPPLRAKPEERTKLKKRIVHVKNLFYSCIIASFLLMAPLVARADNTYPVVLVHGFMGWGSDEMGGYRYWGGFFNLEKYLESQGYEVYIVSIGPISSNWERAVETYYQLKGGQVDYGKGHSEKWGVIQKPDGKTYEGLYPSWDADHPVHVIGHSMGGQTARMLQYLIGQESYEDSARTAAEESTLLGQSHAGWIRSISTIATPHNGTTLSDIRKEKIPFLEYLIGIVGLVDTDFYEFDLEQWNFEREEEESWVDYYRRMRNHPAWETKNFSGWDLSLDGAQQLNTVVTADINVYYFSLVTTCTVLDSTTGHHSPRENMSLLLRRKGRILGSERIEWGNGQLTDSTWFENDGVVNTISQYGPTTGLNGPDPITPYESGTRLQPGRWYVLGPYRMDHWYILGHTGLDGDQRAEIGELFTNHFRLLWSLPE